MDLSGITTGQPDFMLTANTFAHRLYLAALEAEWLISARGLSQPFLLGAVLR